MSVVDFYAALGVDVPDRSGWVDIRCFAPDHEDRNASCGVNLDHGGFRCQACEAKGSAYDAAVLRGRSPRDAADLCKRFGLGRWNDDPEGGRGARGSTNRATVQHPVGCSLEQYAKHKRLPVEFLRGLGVTDYVDGRWKGVRVLRIPYRTPNGEEPAVRIRHSLDKPAGGGDRFLWRKGSRLLLYGLDRLDAARQAGHVVLVEGESDCHTLWHHGVPALGLPGANAWDEQRDAQHLAGIDQIYLVVEPDKGGEAVLGWLSRSAIKDRAWLVGLDGHKDPSGLHMDDPDRFKERWNAALEDAEPWRARAAQLEDAADHLRAGHGLDDLQPVAAEAPAGRHVVLTPARAIRSERVRWMWSDRVPLRGLTVLAGEKGLGKSICTNALIPSQLTKGTLDGELEGHPIDVLVASAEDDWRAVVKPRLMAHGADLDRVHRVAVTDENGDGIVTLPDDVAMLETAIAGLREAGRPVGLLVVDPIGAFLTQSTDSHKDAHVRRALAPLASMADRLDLAVVVVAHLTKDDSRRLISRVNGSGAFVNAARSVVGFVRDPDDPDGEQGADRVIVHAASNWGKYAPSLAAKVEAREVAVDDGSTAEVGYLKILGETAISVEDVQRGRDDDHESVEAAIIAELDGGERPSLDIKEAVAKRLGCSLKTVERHAVKMRDRGELTIEKSGWPPTSTWTPTLGTTSDTGNVPNGVPNAKAPINTGDSRDPEHVRDTSRVSVPNGTDATGEWRPHLPDEGAPDWWRAA